jgi:hypothetical protein
VAASSAAWGWQSSKSDVTIPKSFGFEAATQRIFLFLIFIFLQLLTLSFYQGLLLVFTGC